MYNEVIVVEGYHDLDKIKKIYKDIDVIVTNGSEIKESLPIIIELSKTRDIILFLDPDYPGERIRKIISSKIKNCKHAFIPRDKAFSHNRKKIGVEHASLVEIKKALDNVLSEANHINEITNSDLINLGYVGNKNSSLLRDTLSSRLNIGHTNAKTLLKRLNLFGIKKENLYALTEEIKNENIGDFE